MSGGPFTAGQDRRELLPSVVIGIVVDRDGAQLCKDVQRDPENSGESLPRASHKSQWFAGEPGPW